MKKSSARIPCSWDRRNSGQPGPSRRGARTGVAGHPDAHLDLGLGDIQAGDPLHEQGSSCTSSIDSSYDERAVTVAVVRRSLRHKGNLVRGLEAPFSGPEDKAPGVRLFNGVQPAKEERRQRTTADPVSTPPRARARVQAHPIRNARPSARQRPAQPGSPRNWQRRASGQIFTP